MNLARKEIHDLQAQATIDGYIRGVLGMPLDVEDVGLTQAQRREKYQRLLEERQRP